MNAKVVTQTALLLLSSILFIGCSKGEGTTSLTINGEGSSLSRARAVQSLAIIDAAGNQFTITEARVAVRHVEFGDDSDSSQSYKLEGPFVVDLLTGVSEPEMEVASDSLVGIDIERVDVRIDDVDDDYPQVQPSDELFDYSLYVEGADTDGTPLVIQLKFNEDIRFDFLSPITVEGGESYDMTLALRMVDWFSAIDLTDCLNELSGNDTLVISDESNTCNSVEGDLKTAIKNMYDFN
jgi:hypothetical protein